MVVRLIAVGLLAVPAGCSEGGSASAKPESATAYLGNLARTGFYGAQAAPTPAGAQSLQTAWILKSGDTISSQPVVANGLVYWGSWDGYEHAATVNGSESWRTYVGRTPDTVCSPPSAGPAGAAVAATSNGRPVLYIGGGNADVLALNAITGEVIWRSSVGTPPEQVIWGSPALYKGFLYIGVAALGECAPSHGQLIKINSASGAVDRVFNVVPIGCSGGGIWGSPAIDEATGIVYVATGDADDCDGGEPNATAILALRAGDLHLVDHWQVPASEQIWDSDFGSTPTLFDLPGRKRLLGITNKNGFYYVFDRGHLAAGPVWRRQVARGGSCPFCGEGSIAASAWDGRQLYVAGGKTEIAGGSCKGSLRAFDPVAGAIGWELCLDDGPVLAPVIAAPGLITVGSGPSLVLVSADSGRPLFTLRDPDPKSAFLAAPLFERGVLYAASSSGRIYALS
jgi:polyvinyl alcohol dehydrogenase (cytochrome)